MTDRRVIGTRGRAKWVDVSSEVATGGPATLTLDGTSLHVRFDLDRVHQLPDPDQSAGTGGSGRSPEA